METEIHEQECMCQQCMDSAPKTIPKSGFHFDKPAHIYWLDGKKIPGVSRILELCAYRKEWNAAAELAAARGTNVHRWLEIEDRGELDQYEKDEAYNDAVKYIVPWRAAKQHIGIEKFDLIEHSGYWSQELIEESGGEGELHTLAAIPGNFAFGGTCDRVAKAACGNLLIDIKTASTIKPVKYYRLQTALYAMIFGVHHRCIVWLDGKPFDPNRCIEWHTNDTDFSAAEAALIQVKWRADRTKSAPPPEPQDDDLPF